MLVADIVVAFQRGKELSNSAKHKRRQVFVNALTAFLLALAAVAKGFGYDFQLSEETAAALSTGIVAGLAIYNSVLTTITTTKIGLPPKSEADKDTGGSAGDVQEP